MARAENVLRLLLVDDSPTDADLLISSLRRAGHAVRASRYDDLDDIQQALSEYSWDLILCRSQLATISPQQLIQLIHKLGRDVSCIILASTADELAQLYKLGAHDVILWQDFDRLAFAVARELKSLFIRRLGRRNERALRESEKRCQLLLATSHDAVAYVHEGMHIYINDAYLNLFGYESQEDVDGLSILDLVSSDDHARFKTAYREFSENLSSAAKTVELRCVRENTQTFQAEIEFSHAEVEGENCTQLVIQERSEGFGELVLPAKEATAFREIDVLTGLYNRIRFTAELEQAISHADNGHGPSELLYLVIDDVQMIKDKVGLSACDAVFKGVADLLRLELLEGEILARYSDQVFTILIASGDDLYVDERANVFSKTIDAYASQTNGKVIELQCSIGISRITENLAAPEIGLERADKACSQAQHKGGNRIVRYQPTSSEQGIISSQIEPSDEQIFWQERIKESLAKGNFELHYQPIVTLHGKEQEIYDVLIRMKENDGKVIVAENFIKYIEDSEIMGQVDEWVINNAFASLHQHKIDNPKTHFFIKLSKHTLNKANFIDWIQSLLVKNSIEGSDLVFELSETVALENLDHAQSVIAKLKTLGCEFCLEHFGSGLDFSHSLNVLDVDYLKINGAFVENMAKDPENQAAVKAIIEMSKKAGKQSIAEFVSDANSLALLWRLGVDYVMGYYIQEPSADLDYNFEEDDL